MDNWSKRAVALGVGAGLILGVLQVGWHYIANVAVMGEPVRTFWKETLFALGLLVLLAVSVIAALRGAAHWKKHTAIAAALTIGVATLFRAVIFRAAGIRANPNSLFLGDPSWIQALAGAAGLVLLVAVSVAFSVAVGGIARFIAMRLGSRSL